MSYFESGANESTDLEPRDVRALTEYMTVLKDVGRARDAPDLYLVVGENGGTYLVDAREDTCECSDAHHNLPTDDGRERCKHRTRVAFTTGERAIPAWVDADTVDPNLADCVAATPRVVATDAGQVLEDGARVEGGDGHVDAVDDERPDDCECWNTDAGLPCFACWMAGFDAPNPSINNE